MIDQQQVIIQKTAEYIKQKFMGETSGHDWWHIHRVWQLARDIADSEPQADRTVVELTALLHDIKDWKSPGGGKEAGFQAARDWLESIDAEHELVELVVIAMRGIPFRGSTFDAAAAVPIESQIVYDADNLDAIGAIGIARVFAYAGAKGKQIYQPDTALRQFQSFEEYIKAEAPPAITHIHERLLLLKDRMFTERGKKLAEHRHRFLEDYLAEFHAEWDGER